MFHSCRRVNWTHFFPLLCSLHDYSVPEHLSFCFNGHRNCWGTCGLLALHHCSVIVELERAESSNWSNRWKALFDILKGKQSIYRHRNMCTGQDMFVGHVWYENSGMSDISYVVSSGVLWVRHSSDKCFWVKPYYGNYNCIKMSRLKCACMYLVT